MTYEPTSYPKEKINIILLENISSSAVKIFNSNGYTNVQKLNGALSEDELIKAVKDVHLLGIRSKTHISELVVLNGGVGSQEAVDPIKDILDLTILNQPSGIDEIQAAPGKLILI